MADKNKEKDLVYAVLVLRTDQNHITVLESNNYDECFNCWSEMTNKWSKAAKEGVPFELSNPIVTAFSPGMITEITLVPVTTQDIQSKSHNPYYQNMMEKGLTNAFGFNNSTNDADLLDKGYKR